MSAKEDRKRPVRTPVSRNSGGAVEDGSGGNVGNALRSVYDQTVNEDIPGVMLDLLGKLA